MQYKRRGKTRTKKLPITRPIALSVGSVPVRMELRSKTGKYDGRGGYDLLWRGPFDEKAVSAALVSVKPWPDMYKEGE